MLEVGSFVVHRTKTFDRGDDPPLPLYGSIVKDNGESWSIEWIDKSQTYENKNAVMEA